jgi:hypothetical protein
MSVTISGMNAYSQSTDRGYAYEQILDALVLVPPASNIGAPAPRQVQLEGIAITVPLTITAATYTQATQDAYVIFNNASANTTMTLLSASQYPGKRLVVKNLSGSFTVISGSSNVVPRTSATAGTAVLAATAGAWAELVSDGTNWIVMSGS